MFGCENVDSCVSSNRWRLDENVWGWIYFEIASGTRLHRLRSIHVNVLMTTLFRHFDTRRIRVVNGKQVIPATIRWKWWNFSALKMCSSTRYLLLRNFHSILLQRTICANIWANTLIQSSTARKSKLSIYMWIHRTNFYNHMNSVSSFVTFQCW